MNHNGEIQPNLQSIIPQRKILKLYSPHLAQLKFHELKSRFRVASWGRQAGKSTACLNDLLHNAWIHPGQTLWFVSPTYDQAQTQYRRMIGMLSPCWEILVKKNQTELRTKLVNQSTICFKSGEVLDNLRGETLHGVVVDEVRQQDPSLWSMVIRPMLATTKGWAAFVSTPNGFDQFYDFFQRGKKDKDWESLTAPSTANPLITQEEIDAAKNDMSEDEFAQEMLAEFREMGAGKAYKNHGSWNQVNENPFTTSGEWSTYLPVVVGLDFNVGLMVWVLGQVKGQNFYFGDEIAVKNTDSEECAHILAKRVQNHKQGVVLVGDSSGNARKTSAAGQTDYKIIHRVLREYNIKFEDRTPSENPFVKDRINCINGKLKAADGSVHLWYHTLKCPYLKRDLERVKWKEGTDGAVLDKSDPLATHATDSMGYPVCHFSNLLRQDVGRLMVVNR